MEREAAGGDRTVGVIDRCRCRCRWLDKTGLVMVGTCNAGFLWVAAPCSWFGVAAASHSFYERWEGNHLVFPLFFWMPLRLLSYEPLLFESFMSVHIAYTRIILDS